MENTTECVPDWFRYCLIAAFSLASGRAQDLSIDALLPRIQHNVAEYVAAAPNYTCTEVIHRQERPRRVKDFQTIDRVKLEIAVLNGTERFAWPGSSQFEDKDIQEIVGGGYGALTKGDFVMHARNIFLRDQATFTSVGADKLGDRDAIRLDYQVPLVKSNFEVRADGQKAVVGYRGAAWVDRETLQLLRIDIEAVGIPRELRVRSLKSEIDYAPVQLGQSRVLLPRSSQYTLQHLTRVDLSSRIEFHGCRQYAATSNISFEDARPTSHTQENAKSDIRLPAGTILPIRLTEAINSDTASVGDMIAAVTTKRIQASRDLVLPGGTIVHGRIRKMERHFEPITYFVVGLEFNELEMDTRRIRFFAEEDTRQAIGMLSSQDSIGPEVRKRIVDAVPTIPGVGIYVVTADRVHIAKGYTMIWEIKERSAATTASRSGVR